MTKAAQSYAVPRGQCVVCVCVRASLQAARKGSATPEKGGPWRKLGASRDVAGSVPAAKTRWCVNDRDTLPRQTPEAS